MLEAKSLRKAVIPSSLFPHPSPGHLQSTRLAIHVHDRESLCSVFVASGCHVYNVQISTEESMVTKGKESLLIPVQVQEIKSSLVDRCPHRSEIQSVVLAEEDGDNCLIMGTVDSYGHLIVSRLDVISADFDRLSYSVPPRHCGIGESSWAGVCFCPTRWSMAAVAHGFGKSIDVYEQDIHLRSLRTLWYPASLSYLQTSLSASESSTLVVAEGSQLSVWDLRANSNGGCVQRVCGAIGDIIYTVCSSPSGPIAAGGSDRTVTIYDPRRWSSVSRWVHCSKYEITGLSFSLLDSDYIYVQGVDYEMWAYEHFTVFRPRYDHHFDGLYPGGIRWGATMADHLGSIEDMGRLAGGILDRLVIEQARYQTMGPRTGGSSSSADLSQLLLYASHESESLRAEISCGQWKESEKIFSFRGDSNWLGFSKCANKDVLAGWCESGSIFVADVVLGQDSP